MGKILDGNDSMKYPQLFPLVKCVLSLSYGNSVPKRGFSINKILLDAHRHSIKEEDTIVALHFVKDKLHSVGGAIKFVINRNLVESCKAAHAKSVTDEEKKLMEREEETKRLAKAARKEKEQQDKKKELEKIERMIIVCRNHLDVADGIVDLGTSTLKAVISSGKMNMAELVSAQAKIDMGLNRKRSIQNEIDQLESKKKKILRQK